MVETKVVCPEDAPAVAPVAVEVVSLKSLLVSRVELVVVVEVSASEARWSPLFPVVDREVVKVRFPAVPGSWGRIVILHP